MSVLVAAALLLTVRAIADDSAEEILARVREAYDEIEDAELHFSQKTSFDRTQLEQTASGELFLKKGHRYRLETGDHTIVTDGVNVWSYSRLTDQVVIDLFYTDERVFTPERILTGGPEDFVVTTLGKEKIGDRELAVLKLVPREDDSFVTSLRLWVDQDSWLIRQAELSEFNGKKTEYHITSLKTNIGLADELFQYQIPHGADVVDFR